MTELSDAARGGGPAATAEPGPLGEAIDERPPFGPTERLSADRLRDEQRATLAAPRRRASRSARALFATIDLLYGKERSLEKFRVLELVARVPYQAWEHVAYVAVTHTADEPGFARRVFDRIQVNRWEQDNEQWHLLILNEMLARRGHRRFGWVRTSLVPQLMAFAYYHLSLLTYSLRPEWSYRLNADFEDHAEHEYAHYVAERPELDSTPFDSDFATDFGHYACVGDLFRQISYDERIHKLQSEQTLAAGTARFR